MCHACAPVALSTEAFAEHVLGILNGGALGLMVSIGHRTGLFDAMADNAWRTSEKLAEDAGLHERYVREWLGAMVCGRIVLQRGNGNGQGPREFSLPREHAALLSRQHPTDNMAVFTQYLAVLGGVEDDIIECFREGGGVPYEKYPRFHAVMAEDSNQSAVAGLEEHVLPLVPGLVDRLERGIDVLDLGCGRGQAINKLARRFPASRFVGLDLSEEAIERARREAGDLANLSYVVQDATTFDAVEAFDHVFTFDAIHDQARSDIVLTAIRRALRPGGTYLMQDIQGAGDPATDASHPLSPFIYTISCMHCMTVSLAQGGMGLGAAWGRPMAERMLRDAGFASIEVESLEHDVQNFYYVCRT